MSLCSVTLGKTEKAKTQRTTTCPVGQGENTKALDNFVFKGNIKSEKFSEIGGQFSVNEENRCEDFKVIKEKVQEISRCSCTNEASLLADKLGEKAADILESYKLEIGSLKFDIMCLHSNKKMSRAEKQQKIAEVKRKIEAVKKERNTKMKVLRTLAENLSEISILLKTMACNNLPTKDVTSFLENMIDSVNAEPSYFNAKDNSTSINDKIQKASLGNSPENLKNKETETKQEIEKTESESKKLEEKAEQLKKDYEEGKITEEEKNTEQQKISEQIHENDNKIKSFNDLLGILTNLKSGLAGQITI